MLLPIGGDTVEGRGVVTTVNPPIRGVVVTCSVKELYLTKEECPHHYGGGEGEADT